MAATELELRPLLPPNFSAKQQAVRNDVFLPENDDPVTRLFYLTTLDQPEGKVPLRQHQVTLLGDSEKESVTCCEPNFKVLSVVGVVAIIGTVFTLKVLESSKPNPWVVSVLGTVAVGALLTGAAYFVPWHKFRAPYRTERQAENQFKAMANCLKEMKTSNPEQARFLASNIKAKNIKKQLESANIKKDLITAICTELKAAKNFVKGKAILNV